MNITNRIRKVSTRTIMDGITEGIIGNGIVIKGNGKNNKSILRARDIIGQTVITSRGRSGKGIEPDGIKTIRVNSSGGITAKMLNGTTIINGTILKISKQIDGTTAPIGINLNINKKMAGTRTNGEIKK